MLRNKCVELADRFARPAQATECIRAPLDDVEAVLVHAHGRASSPVAVGEGTEERPAPQRKRVRPFGDGLGRVTEDIGSASPGVEVDELILVDAHATREDLTAGTCLDKRAVGRTELRDVGRDGAFRGLRGLTVPQQVGQLGPRGDTPTSDGEDTDELRVACPTRGRGRSIGTEQHVPQNSHPHRSRPYRTPSPMVAGLLSRRPGGGC